MRVSVKIKDSYNVEIYVYQTNKNNNDNMITFTFFVLDGLQVFTITEAIRSRQSHEYLLPTVQLHRMRKKYNRKMQVYNVTIQ